MITISEKSHWIKTLQSVYGKHHRRLNQYAFNVLQPKKAKHYASFKILDIEDSIDQNLIVFEFRSSSPNFENWHTSYYKRQGMIIWSLLHSQRWRVHLIWYFRTTSQLVCFQSSFDYHPHQPPHFRQKQQNNDDFRFGWNKPTSGLTFFCVLTVLLSFCFSSLPFECPVW